MDPELQMMLSQRLAQRVQAMKAKAAGGQPMPEVPAAEPGSALDTVDSGALVDRLERIRAAARRRSGGQRGAGR